jgi:single-stranded-DNA-specific exonuclease
MHAPRTQTVPAPAAPDDRRWLQRSLSAEQTAAPFLAAGWTPEEARLALFRGLNDPDAVASFGEKSLKDLPNPLDLPDMDRAAKRLADAVRQRHKILIHGDYDTDGCCASSILVRALHALRHREVEVFIPHRIEHGYGLSEGSLSGAVERKPDLFITVDCGTVDKGYAAKITAATGADVIITDHHLMGERMPEALACVNPNIPTAKPGLGMLCGAAVAWCLAVQTCRELCGGERVTPELRDTLMRLMQLAAVATVVDCVPMKGPNRVIVHHGLASMNAAPLPGIARIAEEMKFSRITTMELGWKIGPVLNANGRLGSAMRSYDILSSDDTAVLDRIVPESIQENLDRREISTATTEEAAAAVEAMGVGSCIVVANPNWHPGVVGIVAGRLVERFNRPAIVIGATDDSGKGLKGSARTIDGFHLGNAIFDARDLLVAGGGHAKAAGVTIAPHQVDAFRARMCAAVDAAFPGGIPSPTVTYDLEIAPERMTPRLFQLTEAMGPYGEGHREPLIRLPKARVIGRAVPFGKDPKTEHVRGVLAGPQESMIPFIAFRMRRDFEALSAGHVDCLVKLEINRFKGMEEPRVKIDVLAPEFRAQRLDAVA